MGVSVRARRAWAASFVIAIVAASCALPGYEVGESSSASSVASTGGGGDMTSSATGGGAGGAGGANVGGMGGMGGMGGAGGELPCPVERPAGNTACQLIGAQCMYPSNEPKKTCCLDKMECTPDGSDPSKGFWATQIAAQCPPSPCPHDCSDPCPDMPAPGCPCRPLIASEYCAYNFCGNDGSAHFFTCEPKEHAGFWAGPTFKKCCVQNSQTCEVGQECTMDKDASGMTIEYCVAP